MNKIEMQWLFDEVSQKEGLQKLLNCSGQLLKKHLSSAELKRAIRARDLISLPLDLVNHLRINPIYHGPLITVLRESDEYIALHKPSLVHGHPLEYSDTNTVLNFLAQNHYFAPLQINVGHYDRGLLFRLDFETSGVLILAKSEKFHSLMRNNFHQHMKRKFYLAIVEGDFNQEGEWTHYFKAAGPKGSMQKVTDHLNPDSMSGSLKVKKIVFHQDKSLLLVELKTGLRHQIRAQIAHLGFPLLGDELYGGNKSHRLFLHAWRYEWSEIIQDDQADLFDCFFNLSRALEMGLDMIRVL